MKKGRELTDGKELAPGKGKRVAFVFKTMRCCCRWGGGLRGAGVGGGGFGWGGGGGVVRSPSILKVMSGAGKP